MTWKPADGMTPKQEEKELQRQALLFEEKCRSGQVLAGNVTFAAFVEQWKKNYAEKELKVSTYSGYCDMLKRILPAIGHLRLDKLQPHHLLTFYANLGEEGIRADTKYRCIIDAKALLKERKLKKKQVAEAAGVSLQILTSMFHGDNINRYSAEAVARALEMKMDKLFAPAGDNAALSDRTMLLHHRVISSILSTAVQWQIIPANPCARVKPPKTDKKEARYLDEDQAAQLLDALQSEPVQYRTMIILLLYTGMRRGELCGLEWNDVDFEKKIIHIQRNSLYLPEHGIYVDSTKNESSERVIRVSDEVIRLLQEFKRSQNAERLTRGDRWEDSGRLFVQWNGKPIHPDTISNWFTTFVRRNNLPSVSVHSLRHTNATLQIAAHVPLTTVQKRLGHAHQSTTGNIYAHAIKSADAAAAEVLEDILNPSKRQVEG